MIAAVGVSSWLVAVEPATISDPRADELRTEAFRRAAVRLSPAVLPIVAENHVRDTDFLSCTFLSTPPTGTTPKFDCLLANGETIKVKYGRNPEIHSEVATTRLLTALGFAADQVTIVPRLRCHGCPRYPYFTMTMLQMVRAPDLLAPHGYAGTYSDFEWVSIERKFPAPSIETPTQKGWAWW